MIFASVHTARSLSKSIELFHRAAVSFAESGEPDGPALRVLLLAVVGVIKDALASDDALSARLDAFENEGLEELEARARTMREAATAKAEHERFLCELRERRRDKAAKAAWRASGGRGAWNMLAKIREAVRLRKLRLA
jgi:muramoyltetrapeptide carboxypeptidase LdcA involved in peptidoglycan recycling